MNKTFKSNKFDEIKSILLVCFKLSKQIVFRREKKKMKFSIIFLAVIFFSVHANKREKRTINRVLRYFGYRLMPVSTDAETVSERYQNSPEIPSFLRLRTILPSRLAFEWTTEGTRKKSENIKMAEETTTTKAEIATTSKKSTLNQVTTTRSKNSKIEATTSTPFIIKIPDIESIENFQEPSELRDPRQAENEPINTTEPFNTTEPINTTEPKSTTDSKVDDPSLNNPVMENVGYSYQVPNQNLNANFEVVKSNDIYLGSMLVSDNNNYNPYQYITPRFENINLQDINSLQNNFGF